MRLTTIEARCRRLHSALDARCIQIIFSSRCKFKGGANEMDS